MFTTDIVVTRCLANVLSDEPINVKYKTHSMNPRGCHRQRVEEIFRDAQREAAEPRPATS